jgi:hypothetical protein
MRSRLSVVCGGLLQAPPRNTIPAAAVAVRSLAYGGRSGRNTLSGVKPKSATTAESFKVGVAAAATGAAGARTFLPPAYLTDITTANLPKWSALVSEWHNESRATPGTDDYRPQFYNL